MWALAPPPTPDGDFAPEANPGDGEGRRSLGVAAASVEGGAARTALRERRGGPVRVRSFLKTSSSNGLWVNSTQNLRGGAKWYKQK